MRTKSIFLLIAVILAILAVAGSLVYAALSVRNAAEAIQEAFLAQPSAPSFSAPSFSAPSFSKPSSSEPPAPETERLPIESAAATTERFVQTLPPPPETEESEAPMKSLAVALYEDAAYKYAGDTLTFGAYEQDNDFQNGTEPIEWIILEKTMPDNGDLYLTLISRYGLDNIPYHTTRTSITWENCSLRSWLNDNFFYTAFDEEEQALILFERYDNPDNDKIAGGNETYDRVSLLSIDEAKSYFATKEERAAYPTPYAVACGASVADWTDAERAPFNGCCFWWLRSPGRSVGSAGGTGRDGSVYTNGYFVDSTQMTVRPVISLYISAK